MKGDGPEISVRMGELATSAVPGDVLACVGLGSCIALVLVDLDRSVAGLAHIVLPDGDGRSTPAKYADTAVPELIKLTLAAGAARGNLRAALVGGAAMFAFGGAPDQQIGARNERNVRSGLARERIPVVSAFTGGSSGRTLRVTVGDPVVATVRGRATAEVAIALDETGASFLSLVSEGTRVENHKRTTKQATTEVAN